MADDEQRRQFTGGSSKILVLRAVEKRKRAEVIRGRKLDGLGFGKISGVDIRRETASQHTNPAARKLELNHLLSLRWRRRNQKQRVDAVGRNTSERCVWDLESMDLS